MSSVRRQASEQRRISLEALKLLLELGFDTTEQLDEPGNKRRRKASAAPPSIWKDWGTLCNRKVVVKDSRLPNAGRGLFAAQPFRKGQLITIYGGKLLTAKEAAGVESSYLLRISGEGGRQECFYVVDGAHFADRLCHREGDLYLPAPDDPERERLQVQGAGSLANSMPRNAPECNAHLAFQHIGRTEVDQLLPKLPMLIASRDIAADEEVYFDYNSERMKVGTASRAAEWLDSRSPVLRLGELIRKEDPGEVRQLLERVLAQCRGTLQVAFLQGATPLASAELFPLLERLLRETDVFSVNLGEIRLSDEQCGALAAALRDSHVTHMFYECAFAGEWKGTFKEVIAANRSKHARWQLSDDDAQNAVIYACTKNWFNPTRHTCNKRWVESHRERIEPAAFARVQAEVRSAELQSAIEALTRELEEHRACVARLREEGRVYQAKREAYKAAVARAEPATFRPMDPATKAQKQQEFSEAKGHIEDLAREIDDYKRRLAECTAKLEAAEPTHATTAAAASAASGSAPVVSASVPKYRSCACVDAAASSGVASDEAVFDIDAPVEAAVVDTDVELSVRLASLMLLARGATAWAAKARLRMAEPEA